MGLIKAVINAGKEALANQYGEFFYCESIPNNVLLVKGQKEVRRGSTNNPTDNIISDGSMVSVADGQCLLIVENGHIVDFSMETGAYIYKTGTEPSMLTGGLEGLKGSFATFGKRIQFGGMKPSDQRVYFVNTKEIMGNKYGAGDIPFRDSEFNFTMKLKCFGEYSYKIVDPILFYKNVAGNVSTQFKREEIDSQLKVEVQNAIQPSLGRIALKKIPYDQLPLFTKDIAKELNVELSGEWEKRRGLKVESFALASVTPDEDSAKKIEQFQSNRVYTDTRMMGARIGEAQATAMENAASNEGGVMNGFIGMGMVQQAGGMNAQKLFEMKEDTPSSGFAKVSSWICGNGHTENTGNFCKECGAPKVDTSHLWSCSCGYLNSGKFCMECGMKKQETLDAKCEACGFEGEKPFKFCPDCGHLNEN